MIAVLPVKDAFKSAGWYQRLGFEITWEAVRPGYPRVVEVRRAGMVIWLSEWPDAGPLLHLSVDDIDDVADDFGRSTEEDEGSFQLLDPDGNRLRISG